MKLENQVVSLELAKRLKELGFDDFKISEKSKNEIERRIKELLKSEINKMLEEIKAGMPGEHKDNKTFDFIDKQINPRHDQGFTDGYNQYRQEALEVIDKFKIK